MRLTIPQQLIRSLAVKPEGVTWLQELPTIVAELVDRWSLTLGRPIEEEATCSWVAPCTRSDGTQAILKLGFPHMEAAHEIDGLAFWDGNPAVFLLDADRSVNAMLLEPCIPGKTLRSLPEADQDVVIAGLLRNLWRTPPAPHPFRHLAEMIHCWCAEARGKSDRWPDKSIAEEGLRVCAELVEERPDQPLLATDLHAGNVLRARRMPWLVIDPKPFIGDPCYDATQHLLNCRERLKADPVNTIDRFANLLDLDETRVRRWTFARLAIECDGDMTASQTLARRVLN